MRRACTRLARTLTRGAACVRVRLCVPDPLFVAFVQDNALWWFQRGYAPKNGVAGVRGKPYKWFRDHVILEALRIYRSRTEGLPLESVPPVVYSWKPSAGVSGGQRGIVGFERYKATVPAIPLPPEAKALPIDDETTLLPHDAKADHLAGELDEMYREALQSLQIVVLPKKKQIVVLPTKKRARKASPGPPAKRSRTLMEFTVSVCEHAFVKEPSPGYCNSCGAIDGKCRKCGAVVCLECA